MSYSWHDSPEIKTLYIYLYIINKAKHLDLPAHVGPPSSYELKTLFLNKSIYFSIVVN